MLMNDEVTRLIKDSRAKIGIFKAESTDVSNLPNKCILSDLTLSIGPTSQATISKICTTRNMV
jgi:hypothetical protein